MKTKKIIKYIISWLKEYIHKSQSNGFIIGISGGIDSSVTSCLVSMTKFPTIILEMPILENRKNCLSIKHAKFLTDKFSNVSYLKKDLSILFTSFCHIIEKKNEKSSLALANVQARLRMLTLYYYANMKNYLVVGTGNKVEDFGVGFFTKYGDGGVDLHPIADLTKSEVRFLAKELNIAEEIQKVKPMDGLWEDQRSDEEQLGASYEQLEWAMKITKKKGSNFYKEKEYDIFKKYKILNQKNKHKMILIPVCKIPSFLK
ncbi:NAD+ synthase [Blattabacterium sp. (Blattella germanica) str. Bge]|uniref:NAD(+) synthase n=1 Tax=Blattabacterium sp. (Blattella germanica) TaxID=624186 RepID=UPI0001BB6271|nr:NAD(+) synthase [Blattabacterium sp. (Blattella germanica)]ACY40571.1 NAD+ synthase [Blattabacterium sp. (Blattella germanica) str. Bge]